MLGQASSDGSCLLWSKVEREIFLPLVEEAELRSLIGINDSENLCDRFSEIVARRGFQYI